MRPAKTSSTLLILVLAAAGGAQGNLVMGKMWTFENPPLAYLEKEYGFKPGAKWLTSLRLASLRFGRGCSASFVSPRGLIMTNHHCVRGIINSAQGDEDWMTNGFYATSLEDEVRLPGLTVQQLISTTNVTNEVNQGINEGDDDTTVDKKRKTNMATIVVAAQKDHEGLTPQIITMHQGAVFQLYIYKVYSDIRLVCAPHLQTSHFGGDPDNFTYPRFGIDFTFCRAYENDKPAQTARHYFRWSKAGPRRGELAFVTGNPGSTGRLLTKGQMSFLREASYPMRLEMIADELRIVGARAATDPSYAKRVRTFLLSNENSQKAIRGYLDSLRDPQITAAKDEAETGFRDQVRSNAELEEKFGGAWKTLARISQERIALQAKLNYYIPYYSKVLARAAAIVNAVDGNTAAEVQARAPLKKSRTYDKLFAAHLIRARRWLGKADPYVRILLGNRTSQAAVERLNKSIVTDDKRVQALLTGGREGLENSGDHAIRVAVFFTKAYRQASAKMNELGSRERVQGSLVGQALFHVYGNRVSPDATFSLRFSDGVVKGFPYNGTIAPYRTTFYGLYARNTEFDNEFPFNLPQRWLDRKDKIDMTKGVNFVATNDIIGGNSGSPMVNKDLQVIGLIFDGNIEMLGNRFLYRDDVPRSVSVHSQAIIEALEKIYDAHRIVEEIMHGSK